MAKAGRPGTQLPVTYAMRIQRWDWSYSLRATGLIGRFEESRHLSLFGEILAPKPFKVGAMEITLLPDPDFYAPRAPKPFLQTGWMNIEHEALKIIQGIPSDILPSLLVGLSSKHLKYAYVQGTGLRYRKGDVVGFSLDSILDEEGLEFPENPLQPFKYEPDSTARAQFEERMEKAMARREKNTKRSGRPPVDP